MKWTILASEQTGQDYIYSAHQQASEEEGLETAFKLGKTPPDFKLQFVHKGD